MLESKFERENPNYKNEPDIKWNFTKFLIGRDGTVLERFEPTTTPEQIEAVLERALAQ